MRVFEEKELEKIYKPQDIAKGGNGQVTIIGGSSLFHGAPLLSLKTASRIVDMVFFTSPEPLVGEVAKKIKSKLFSFIWFPFSQVAEYIEKSDAILIGPGLMRYCQKTQNTKGKSQNWDKAGEETKKITEELLRQFPQKQWVIDAGSLQVMEARFIPKNAILTPNKKEFKLLFQDDLSHYDTVQYHSEEQLEKTTFNLAERYHCIIVLKGEQTVVCSPDSCVRIEGGNTGLTKGGTGDVLAGLTVALAAKNPPLLAACAASFVVKKAADELYQKVGFAYSADDLAEKIPEVLGRYFR